MSKQPESKLPGELNENWGSNYMMDGFWHDMEYEHGLKENPPANPIPQPATSGMSQLPDGMIMGAEFEEILHGVEREEEGGMDLGELGIVEKEAKLSINVDRSDSGVVDHSWIGDAYQDPTRLPNMPVDNGIPELQQAWGDRSDGIQRIDLYDRGAVSYEDALQHEEDDDPLNRDKLAKLVQGAMRRSAAGVPIDTIRRELVDQLGPEQGRKVVGPVRAIGAEHGLVGNVYVRASAYPGLHTGKWGDALKKAAKGSRYLVAGCDGQDCGSCACALGLTLVSSPNEIDWNDAYSHYAPGLEATGRLDRTATVMDKRIALQQAFLRREVTPRTTVEPSRPRVSMPGDGIELSEAIKSVTAFKVPHRVVVDMATRYKQDDAEKVVTKLGQMVRAHLVTPEEAERLIQSKAPPHEILKAAAQIALVVKTARYPGPERPAPGGDISREAAWEGLKRSEAKVAQAEMRRRVRAEELDQKVRMIKAQVNGGLKGEKLAALIRDTLTREEALAAGDVLGPFLKKTGALNPKAPETREYSDATFTRHVAKAPEMDVPTGEIRKAARWVRQQMSEGTAGSELDTLIQLRLGPKVASAAGERIAAQRKEHEGLSGHIYVDAAAYASAEGTTGCEEGGLRHRANGLKFVRAMERCGPCVFKNADGVCQKYNKVLLDEIPDDVAEQFRTKHIEAHEMSDEEQLAAMFSVGTEAASAAQEFDLHNAALDDVDSATPEHGAIDGIFFGGFEL
jgi:hypothetical protein